MSQEDDTLKLVLENVESFNSKFVGTIRNGKFLIFEEDGKVKKAKETRLTKMPMQNAFPPESEEISLFRPECDGKILAVDGRLAGNWIHEARVIIKSDHEFARIMEVPARLCPILEKIANDDAVEIARAGTAALVAVGFIGASPASIALISIAIARIGIKRVCNNFKQHGERWDS